MDNRGRIAFLNYKVVKINYVLNENCNCEEVDIDFNIISDVNVDEENKNMIVRLDVDIFNDAENNNYPFEMSISVEGHFINRSEEPLEKYKANAIARLCDYVLL